MPDNHGEEFRLAREAGLPPDLDVVDRRARLVARTWHGTPELETALVYRGLNLGVPLEQVLVHDLIPVFAEAAKRGGT